MNKKKETERKRCDAYRCCDTLNSQHRSERRSETREKRKRSEQKRKRETQLALNGNNNNNNNNHDNDDHDDDDDGDRTANKTEQMVGLCYYFIKILCSAIYGDFAILMIFQ